MKVVIIMAGGGACGKTTTTQTFAIGDPEEHKELRMANLRKGDRVVPVNWTLYENCGATGNHKSGTDSNTGPGLVEVAFEEVMKHRDIVIVDGMVSSPRWVTMVVKWRDEHPKEKVAILLIHFDFPAEELLNRLEKRRGISKETFRAHMEPRCEGLVKRAALLVNHVYNLWDGELYEIDVFPKDSPDDIVSAIDETLCEIFGDCDE